MAMNEQPKVLICDPIHPDGVALLRQRAHVDICEEALSEEELQARIGAYEAVIVRSRTKLPARVIANGYQLKAIARAGAGLDSIDVHAAHANGIEIINAPDANTIAVAEHTFALLLNLARHIREADASLKAGRWEKSKLLGTGLVGKTLGIVGFGRIGRQVAHRAHAFGMEVLVNQPRMTPELALELGVENVELPDLLRRADFITLHVPLRQGNVGLIGPAELALMKPSAYFINTARGGIVDEEALLAALEEGRLAGAGLDVFEGEPNVMPELVRHPRVLATPHIAASTEDAQRKAALYVAQHVLELLDRKGVSETLSLRIAPVESVIPHEAFDPRRVASLAERIEADGLLVNPPIVTEWGEIYVVLDGATRLSAFRLLNYPHIIVQVVDPDESAVQLHTWYHAVSNGRADELYELVADVPGLEMSPADAGEVQAALREHRAVAALLLDDGRSFRLQADSSGQHGDWLDVLNRLVSRYTEWGVVARTLQTEPAALRAQYTDFAGLFLFPQFHPETVLDVAAGGRSMPAGITRFVIPGRILRLNAPLERLRADEPLAAKSSWLDQFVHEKLAYRKVRYYQEPVVLLDE